MGVTCQILIQRPREGVHKAGRPVLGTVRYAVDEPTEYKDVILSLVGKGECKWKETNHNRHRRGHQPKHRTYVGTEIYVENYISILNKKPGYTAILPVGTYEYHFSFKLPENIPPSFKDDTCSITYKIGLKFEKPNIFSFSKKFTAALNVYGYVKPDAPEGQTIFGLEKNLIRPFSKRHHAIDLKADINNTIFSPGQNASVAFTVTNNTDVKINSVKSEILCYTTYIANCGRKRERVKTIKESAVETPTVPADAVANMTSVLPVLAELYSIQNCKIMIKEYKVKVTLKLPMPYINASVEVPIVIGEKKNERNTEAAVFARQVSGLEAVGGITDGPPSYWEAMSEELDDKDAGGSNAE